MADNKKDVLIIGAGAAGSFYAARLGEAGKSVTVLDAGPEWEMRDLVSSQIFARRLRWGGMPVLPGGKHPYAFNFNAGWGAGGAALHHYGTWPRLHESDFNMQTAHGRGHDWPISYQDLQPYYDRIQKEVGVSGDAQAERWRPDGAEYPLPPLAIFERAEVLKRGFDKLGLNTSPAPMAILSEEYNGRAACIYDGWCDAGCPTGALYNPLVSDVPRAKAADVSFIFHATATRLLMDGHRAAGIEYVDAEGKAHTAYADIVILAASVVHIPTLLLNSVGPGYENGAANSSGLVGKNFMSHALAPVFGLVDEPTAPYLGVNGAQLLCQDDYGKQREGGPFGSYQWLIAPAMKPNDLLGVATTRADLFGQELDDFMRRANEHMVNMLAFVEELPREDNRIELSDQAGPLGIKLPRVVHSFTDETIQLRHSARDQGYAVLKAAGVDAPWEGPIAQAHMMGGMMMGTDRQNSVTNSYGQTHDIANLVIAGSSIFPTGAAVNPTFSIYALSLRSVEHMLAHWSDYAA